MKHLLLALMIACIAVNSYAEAPMDWSQVTSREAALKLVDEGKLFKVLLFPSEFGGQDIPQNVAYVPQGIPEIKEQITGTLIRFVQQGLVNKLEVKPEYKGSSFVPSKINMRAWDTEGKHGAFEPTIDVW